MPLPADEDRLEQSKMSFSQHLEELRNALLKSLAALVLGFLVGLFVGTDVVDYVQQPIRESLETYYRRQAERTQLARLEEMQAAGEPVPADLPAAAANMANQNLAPKDLYVDRAELEHALALGETIDAAAESADPNRFTRERMVRLRVYEPLANDSRLSLNNLNAFEPFTIYMKASFVVGAVLASPFIFYFLWQFVAAGLYHTERKYVYTYMPMSLGLFFAGAALAYFVAFGFVLDFLFWFNEQVGVTPMLRLSEWMSFVLLMPLGFGIGFQLPLVMLLLERLGVFTIEDYTRHWKISVVVICTIAMFLTPPDPGSMIAMSTPLVALYFGGVLLCKHMPGGPLRRRDQPPESASGS